MQSCFVKKCLCNQLNVTDKNYETKMAYITFKMMDIDTYSHKHTIMTRLIHDCAWYRMTDMNHMIDIVDMTDMTEVT